MIVLLAVAQFSLFLTNYQQVVLACRAGAGLAAESNALPLTGAPVPPQIVDAVCRQLNNSGIEQCTIILEHVGNLGAHTEQRLRADCAGGMSAACQEPATPIPASSVRVTVCVPLAEMMPNSMSGFGFDISGNAISCSTTFGFE